MSAPRPDAIPPAPPHSVGAGAAGGSAAASRRDGAPSAGSHPSSDDAASHRRTPGQIAKDIGLFFIAPYVTLGSLAAFPFLGIKLLAQLRREQKKGS